MTSNITARMQAALDYVAAGVPVKQAAATCSVTVSGIYAALRRAGLATIRPRCEACGRLLPREK